MKHTRAIAVLLAVLTVFVTVSCAQDGSQNTDGNLSGDANSSDTIGEADTSGADNWQNNSTIPSQNYEGREIKFINYTYNPGNFKSYLTEVYAEEMTGAAVNDAVFNRNVMIEEKFKIKISEYSTPNLVTEVNNLVASGSNEYDFVFNHIMDQFVMAINGSLINMNNIPTLSYDNSYYLKSVMEDISIGNKNYMTVTDFNMQAYNGAEILYFNKKLVDDYQLTSPYQLVKDGKWTLETFTGLCTAVSDDLDGNGVYDENDRYGIATNDFVWQPFFYGSDCMFITKDSDDIPTLNLFDEKGYDVLSKIGNICSLESTLFSENFNNVIPNGRQELPRVMFMEDKCLFWVELMYCAETLRGMETDFGLLPVPKYDEVQPAYTTTMHMANASATSVMMTADVDDYEMYGYILEDLGYYSHYMVRPEYFETLLTGIISRDEESGEMLEYIFGNMVADFALCWLNAGFPLDDNIRTQIRANTQDYASFFAKFEKSLSKNISTKTEALVTNGN